MSHVEAFTTGIKIDNFTVSKRMLMRCNCYVTSHLEYFPCPTRGTFPLKLVLNNGEFKIRTLASYSVFSNTTIANQLSAHVKPFLRNLALLQRTCWLNLAYSIVHYRYVFTHLPPGLTTQRYSSASNDVCRPRQRATRQRASRQRTKCKLWVILYISIGKTLAADTMMIFDDSPEGLALQSIATV